MSIVIEIKSETANKHGGVSFNNAPDSTLLSMVLSNVDWSDGNLIKDEWASTLAIDVIQNGVRYSARARYDDDPDYFDYSLWDLAFMIEGEIVLEIDDTNGAIYLSNDETEFSFWFDGIEDTHKLLGGDEILQYILAGDNAQIFELIFDGDDTFRMGDGDDVVYGYTGADIIYGNGGNDKIVGGDGHDTVYAGDGDDIIVVGGGSTFDSIVDAGSGNDIVFSYYSWGIEILLGNGDDLVVNTLGNVFGGDGNDTVIHWRDSKNYALSKSPVSDQVTITYYWGSLYNTAHSVESFQFRDITISLEDILYVGDYAPVTVQAVDPIYRFYNTRDKAFFYTSSIEERDYVISNSQPNYTSSVGSKVSETETEIIHRYISIRYYGEGKLYQSYESFLSDPAQYIYEGTSELAKKIRGEEIVTTPESDYFIPDSYGADTSWPYVYQGSTFEAAHSYLNSDTLVPVYRFYNYETGHHFFTISDAEAEMIKGKSASGEWPFNYEGTRFNMYSSDPTPNSVGEELAVHRFYSPSLDRHFFTGDSDEATKMQITGIWNYEGVAFYGEILG